MGTRAGGARLERMKASALWTGDRFQNVHPVLPNLRDPAVPMPSLKDFICGGERRVPRGPLPSMSPLNGWAKMPQSGLRVTWLGHSTMLIEIDGVRILTDPVWGPRASPSALVGPKRFQTAPISLREMPPVDGAATLTALTAAAIARIVPLLPRPPKSWIVAGGGARNLTMMRMLRERLQPATVEAADALGWSADAIEAQAFGFLAARGLKGLPLSYPATTGVPLPMTGGIVARP